METRPNVHKLKLSNPFTWDGTMLTLATLGLMIIALWILVQ